MGGVLAITGPIYLVALAGWVATRLGLFQRADMRTFGKFVLNIALPAMLFNALSRQSLGEVLNPVFIAAFAGGSLLTMGAAVLWARKGLGKRMSAAGIMGMGSACPNSGFIGFPLVTQLFGL